MVDTMAAEMKELFKVQKKLASTTQTQKLSTPYPEPV